MPEDKKEPTATPAAAVEEPKKPEPPKDNFEAKYKELQTEQGKLVEQLKSAQGTLDVLDQQGAIDWNKISGQSDAPVEDNQDPSAALAQRLQRQEGRLLTLQFRLDNPDLKQYEDDLVVPFVLKAKQKNPRKSQDDILRIASEDCRNFLSKHEESILARQKEEKAKDDALKVSGLEAGATTTPEEQVDEQSMNQNYVDSRRKRRAKQMGAA